MGYTTKKATLAARTIVSSGSSLTNNANALSGLEDPTTSAYGGTGTQPGYGWGRYTFTGTFAAAPSANAAIQIYTRLPADGTITGTPGSYCTDLGRSTTPVTPMLCSIPLDTTNTTQSYSSPRVEIPAVPHELIVVNAASGQTISAAWTLTVVPETDVEV